jgi:secreted protein with Ig-like and vWFA domain
VLAAYQEVQKGWDPGRLNDVVIMTDGRNDNPGGLTLDKLLEQLRAVADPKRPIQVVAIGIGNEVGVDELHKIVQVTGGQVFVTADPAKIGDIFLQAIASRPE